MQKVVVSEFFVCVGEVISNCVLAGALLHDMDVVKSRYELRVACLRYQVTKALFSSLLVPVHHSEHHLGLKKFTSNFKPSDVSVLVHVETFQLRRAPDPMVHRQSAKGTRIVP